MSEQKLGSGDVMAALVKRFHAPAWALLEQARQGVATALKTLDDALAAFTEATPEGTNG